MPEAPFSEIQSCAECGFVWNPLSRITVASRISDAVESFVGVIQRAGPDVDHRPTSDRWSILEYGGHLRDVLLSIRERIVLASVLDVPVGTALYRDERIDLGLYAQDAATDVAVELQVVTYLFLKTFAALPERFEERRLVYSDRTPLEVTIGSTMLHALHECQHHLRDAEENLVLLNSTSGT